ncbi:hypothetical protein TNIN_223621 [Trichonephila inaurata madagascariensis]|uniref:Uncharacterized protein n=1 Tax=Trichonephila inaurata madagascariensis TaxID=2747483 RepID=A0A8X6X235_9ARAC|nr:hypothetical protein TNIN_223621 [Trichonephila inaurata madagascariensis]
MSSVIESVPLLLINEFVEEVIKVYTKNGETFEGILMKDPEGGKSVLEGMHMSLKDVKAHFASGHTGNLESILIKGSRIREEEVVVDTKAGDNLPKLYRSTFHIYLIEFYPLAYI